MKRKRLITIAVVAIAVIAGSTFFAVRSRAAGPSTPASQEVAVQRGTLTATVSASGTISPINEAKLSFNSAGKLASLDVKVGDSVKAGQVLASLDTTALQYAVTSAQSAVNVNTLKLQDLLTGGTATDVAAAQANYDSAVAKLNSLKAGPNPQDVTIAKAALDKAQAALAKAQGDYDAIAWRNDAAATAQAVTLQQATDDYQSALATYNKAVAGPTDDEVKAQEAAVLTAKSALDAKTNASATSDAKIAAETLKQSQADLDKAKSDLDNATLKAPFDGIVSATSGNPGEQVSSGTAVVTIVDPNALKVDATVDEVSVVSVKVGQDVSFTLDALPNQQFTGKVLSVSPDATITQGVASYPIVLGITQDANNDLKGGMTAAASIVTTKKDNVLMVPSRAIRRQGNNTTVQVDNNGKPETRTVQIGMNNDTMTEIADGLSEGDKVIIQATTATSGVRGGGLPGAGGGVMFRGPGG